MNAENRNEELILADFLARSTADQQAAAEAAAAEEKAMANTRLLEEIRDLLKAKQ